MGRATIKLIILLLVFYHREKKGSMRNEFLSYLRWLAVKS